ncbi:hypothetical protein CEW92_14010 [Bacillaceae bacterium SAS-127]|nr:hypothetical protein CEW92_14010 [Bacillaceae bacterium SAS-127]
MVLPRCVVLVRWSKSCLYETPCRVIGMSKLAGLEDSPKSECTDKIIGTWEADNVEVLPAVETVIRKGKKP